jgi:hypothetical protein
MLGFKPDPRIWAKVNAAILDENGATVLVTMISGLCALLVDWKPCRDEEHARVHFAAVLLSPDSASKAGSLLDRLPAELARLEDGKWLT